MSYFRTLKGLASRTYAYDPGASVANEDPQPDAGDKQATEEAIDEGKAND